MAPGKQYLQVAGFVQKFGEKPAIETREANGQTVRTFTIKNAGDKLIRITLWPEFAGVVLGEGYWVSAEGAYTASGDNNQFHNISASAIVAIPGAARADREVVNASAGSVVPAATEAQAVSDAAPF